MLIAVLRQNPGGLHKQYQHHNRGNIAHHNGVELFAAEGFAVALHLTNDVIRCFDPADQNRGQQRNQRHHNAVADVIHDVQQLADRTVGQFDLEVEHTVSKGNDSRSGKIDDRQHQHCALSAGVEDLHAVGGDGFQHRDAGSQRGKNCGDEEQQPHNGACLAHRRKDLWQRDKHQARPGTHALGARENVDGGDNHSTRQQGHAGIKNFDLVDRFVQVHVILYVGAVGDHNAHRDAQREEKLAHGIQQNLQKAADGQPLKMRGQVVQKALHAGTGLAVRAGVVQRQRVACNDNDQYQQNRHHIAGDALDAALDTVVDDKRRHAHEQ